MATDLRPTPQDIEVLRGSTFELPYELVDENGDAIDMTGWTLEGALDRIGVEGAGTPTAFTFSTPDETGAGTFTIPGFEDLPKGSYSYWIRYEDAADNVGYAGRGTIRIHDEAP